MYFKKLSNVNGFYLWSMMVTLVILGVAMYFFFKKDVGTAQKGLDTMDKAKHITEMAKKQQAATQARIDELKSYQ